MNPTKVIYKKNENVVFTCDSYVPSTTRWYFNNNQLPSNANPILNAENKLFIVQTKEKNIGFYECIGTTHLGAGFFSAYGLLKKKGKKLC